MKRNGDWMQTFTGRAFWPLDPRIEDVHEDDIAHALSMQCRFAGHTKAFYSVAEHSVRLSYLVPHRHALAGLLHDSAEAYLIDVPRPLKAFLPAYPEWEAAILSVISVRFGVLLDPLPADVKAADEIMLATEKRDLMADEPISWHPLPPPHTDAIVPWSPERARSLFLARLHQLTDKRFGCAYEVAGG